MHMADVDLSIIIPSKNNKAKTAAIIKKISDETAGIEVEFIIIDMDSTDGSVLESLNMIKTRGLRGCVIQSGGSTVGSALNTGLFKSCGKYVTFVYPTKLFKNYISSYFITAEEKEADLIFALPKSDEPPKNPVPEGITGADVAVGLVRSSIVMDFTAVMLNREFLINNHIRFYEDITMGYAEAFIFNALMYNPVIAKVDMLLERDFYNSLAKDDTSNQSNNCFERLDAMIRVWDTVRLRHRNDTVLCNTFQYNKLPSVAMSCVDRLLSEGFGRSSIKKLLQTKKYEKYIDYSADTPAQLKKKIIMWNLMPFAYRP